MSSCRKTGRRRWTKADIEELRRRYPHEPTVGLANDLDRSVSALYGAAALYGLRKTQEYLYSPGPHRLDGKIGAAHRFTKGHVPFNKGMKGWAAGGRSHETQFKKGDMPHTWVPVGTRRRTTKERHWVEKVSESGCQRERWIGVHKLLWMEHHGPIPPKHVVRFIDGDVDNVTIENLECITMVENMLRNTLHRYPPEIVHAIQVRGALNRQINKRARNEK